eukprot:1510528-Amphidinium_carterae.2
MKEQSLRDQAETGYAEKSREPAPNNDRIYQTVMRKPAAAGASRIHEPCPSKIGLSRDVSHFQAQAIATEDYNVSEGVCRNACNGPVSYTHLTLPTILLV